MKKRRLIITLIVFLLLFVGVVTAYYIYNKPHLNIMKSEAAYTVKASELLNEFEIDLAAASEKYVNKVVLVSGKVQSIRVTKNNINVQLAGEGDFFGVNCSFAIEQQKDVEKIKMGDQVEVKGECKGYIDDVVLNNCILVN